MKINKTLLAAVLSAGLFSATSAHAVLTLTLGGQGVYDSDLNITWLQNANLAATNTFGVSGIDASGTMNWHTAQNWITAMNTYNGTGYLGYTDWRLPDVAGCWMGSNCTNSEIIHLYYNEIGGLYHQDILITHNSNYNLFNNIQHNPYWYNNTYSGPYNTAAYADLNPAYSAANWIADKTNSRFFAWAVRNGDSPVVTSPVPEPETYAMLLAGLGLLSFTARRRKQRA